MSAVAAFMAGVREEEQRAEERAFRESQLALEERKVGALEDRLSFDEEEAKRQAEFTKTKIGLQERQVDISGGQLDLSREEFEFTTEQAEQERLASEQRHQERAAGAREALVQRFQYPRTEANRLDDQAAIQIFESLDSEHLELMKGRSLIQAEAMGQLGVLLDVTRQERQDAFTEFQAEQERFDAFLTEGITSIPESVLAEHGLPTDHAQAQQTLTDPEMRGTIGRQLYHLFDPRAAERRDLADERLGRMSAQRDAMVQQMNDMLGNPTMIGGMIGGFSGEEVLGTTGTFETLSSMKQAEEIAHWSMRAARSPVDFARQLGELRARGFPVEAIFERLGISEQEFTEQIEESLEMARRIGAQDPTGAVHGSLGIPSEGVPRPAPPQGGVGRPDISAREEMRRELREIVAPTATGVPPHLRAPHRVDMERFLSSARRALGAGAISLSEVLEMLPESQRSFAEDRLPGRVSR